MRYQHDTIPVYSKLKMEVCFWIVPGVVDAALIIRVFGDEDDRLFQSDAAT